MHRLCYKPNGLSDDDTLCIPVDFISDIDAFQYAVVILTRLQRDVDRIKYVETAYQDFLDLKSTLRKYTRIDQINLERKTRSFFLEFGIFHDHWRKAIAHHPKRDEFNRLFIQVTGKTNNPIDYELAKIIRNYVTHSASIIQCTFWDHVNYDIGFFTDDVLQDRDRNKKKKDRKITEQLPSEIIWLSPIMKGALEKLKQIHEALIIFLIDDDIRNAMFTVAEGINRIKEHGDEEWCFVDDGDQELDTEIINGKTVEYIKGKAIESFYWKDIDELITTVTKIVNVSGSVS